jgi:hypothetical protein
VQHAAASPARVGDASAIACHAAEQNGAKIMSQRVGSPHSPPGRTAPGMSFEPASAGDEPGEQAAYERTAGARVRRKRRLAGPASEDGPRHHPRGRRDSAASPSWTMAWR